MTPPRGQIKSISFSSHFGWKLIFNFNVAVCLFVAVIRYTKSSQINAELSASARSYGSDDDASLFLKELEIDDC